jgi:hypothetical protein
VPGEYVGAHILAHVNLLEQAANGSLSGIFDILKGLNIILDVVENVNRVWIREAHVAADEIIVSTGTRDAHRLQKENGQ